MIGNFLKEETASLHDRVDTAFGGFDLADRDGYSRFLNAQARALLPIEAALQAVPDLPPWRPRAALLRADLADLGLPVPDVADIPVPPSAQAHGMLYVIEGSRLGGALLSRMVADFPLRFLGDRHRQGEWRALLAAIDLRAQESGPQWRESARVGASRAFAAFEAAARDAREGT